MKKLFIAVILIVLSAQLYAVDGYKNLKFGMGLGDVFATDLCAFTFEDYANVKKNGPWSIATCHNFTFLGKSTTANFYIHDTENFLRLVINVDVKDSNMIAKAIVKKYGRRSSPTKKIDIKKELKKPNNQIWLGFDNDTVYLLITTDQHRRQSVYLIYKSPLYNKLLEKMKETGKKEDI